ncbi:hypothetical protein JD844_034264 [Phrynosoma platyrhinos]|uniref:Transmembrane 6 superfamily member 1/2 transmembrane domain-containing protein n=1 Tax=Phrynosoma platyrhinos TaxID=52577 RepID=A0ABQ7T8G2_PHRPL|nr:hypothetical protein JD844_034264 [Phrynosoma platyrhinos]
MERSTEGLVVPPPVVTKESCDLTSTPQRGTDISSHNQKWILFSMGEPYLSTAYGIMICYWDAVIHYALYLAMIIAIAESGDFVTCFSFHPVFLVACGKIAEEQRKTLFQRPLDLGLVVLDCPSEMCFDYVYQQEPYLRDPVAYPKVQFSHIGSSLHQRTPFPYRTPEGTWWTVVLSNVIYALGPHLLVYRCLRNPAFFSHSVSQDKDKKTQ